MKRVYKIRISDVVCYSTRIVDVFIFLKRFLLADCKDAYYSFDLEVHRLNKESSCTKVDESVKSLPNSMKLVE